MTPKLKKIILAVFIIGALFVAYALFIKPDPSATSLINDITSASSGNQDARILSAQISQALLKIQQIKLDRDIFDNPVFASLQDRSQEIADEPIGRSNPFAPLGDTSVNLTSRSNLTITDSHATSTATSTSSQATSTSSATSTPAR